jgi:hypothetical protein
MRRGGIRKVPLLLCALLVLQSSRASLADFRRADANRDGGVNVADVVTLVHGLLGDGTLPCEDAADANDDGSIDLSDAVRTLSALFGDDPTLPFPGRLNAGPDLTCDPLSCNDATISTPGIVLSEISYNPLLSFGTPQPEFIEIHNRTSVPVDLTGYSFTNGISFEFEPGTVIPPNDYMIVVRNSELSAWSKEPVVGRVAGQFEGVLANGGERVTLMHGECMVETVRYDDRHPWPIAPDGYGPPLERIDYHKPADDYHSWRTSLHRTSGLGKAGTPATQNTTLGTPTRPTIVSATHSPSQPTSTDSVTVRVLLDAEPDVVRRVTLRSESAIEGSLTEPAEVVMANEPASEFTTQLVATLPPRPSQTVVRYHLRVELSDGGEIYLPHPGDQNPIHSYFVYDGEIEAKLPVLWLFPAKRSGLLTKDIARKVNISAAAIKEVDADFPELFDGALVTQKFSSSDVQGHNLKFLKGAEYHLFPSGDRSLNILFENRGSSAHNEHLALEVFRAAGAPVQWSKYYRVFDFTPIAPEGAVHTQRFVFQQVSERMFRMNDIGAEGDLYKVNKLGFGKKTNRDTGQGSLTEFFRELNPEDPERRRRAVLERLDLDSARLYSAVSVLIYNWDGFHNNHFVYNELLPGSRWKFFPWDLDTVFSCPSFPVTYPLDGLSACVERPVEPILQAFHQQPELHDSYLKLLRHLISPQGAFTEEKMTAKINSIEDLLLEDLALQEANMGISLDHKRSAIAGVATGHRNSLRPRIEFLRGVLGSE